MLEYGGYWLEGEVGNNAFTFQERASDPRLWIPPLKEGGLNQLALGDLPVFSELNEKWELERFSGFQHLLFFDWKGIPTYIFDNHNHAFAFRWRELFKWTIRKGLPLLHLDQHSDMQENAFQLQEENWEAVVHFANACCTVGNFIPPALDCGLVASVEQIRTEQKLLCYEKPACDYLLDIDLDFWEEQMGIVNLEASFKKTKNLMQSAKMITIATSPYFLDQQKALDLIKLLFD